MVRRLNKRPIRLEPLEPRYVLDSTVVFSELMYNPSEGDQLEWIELHNQMAVKMDVSGWTIQDGVEYTIPHGTTIDGGEYLVIAANPDALMDAHGISALGPFAGSLSNSGERLTLYERSGREMNSVRYQDRDAWPAASDGSGASLAKWHRNGSSSEAENWTFSPQLGGTPGTANFTSNAEPPQVDLAISFEDPWKYEDSSTDLGDQWRQLEYDDAAWSTGLGVFYADGGAVAFDEPELITVSSATATTAWSNRIPENLINGSGLAGGIHDTNVDNMWLSNNDSGPEVVFDLGSVQALSQMRVWNYAEYRPDLGGRVEELLGRSVNEASILVSDDGITYTQFLDTTLTEIRPENSTEDFSDVIDFQGATARFVKIDIHSNYAGKDYNDPTSNDGFGNFTGLSEVQFFTAGDSRETELASAQTHYFRREFQLGGTPERTELILQTIVDDGAVFYVNGQEVHRVNLPDGVISFGTPASSEVAAAVYSDAIPIPNGALREGANVLAVETHQGVSSDMVFHAELTTIVSPVDTAALQVPIALNEISGASDGPFQLELVNHGEAEFVGGLTIRSSSGESYQMPSQTIDGGSFVTLTGVELGFSPTANDSIFLLDETGQIVVDGVDVTSSARAREAPGVGAWLQPSELTIGAENRFRPDSEIVINEIMYHHRPEFPRDDVPGTFDTSVFLPLDATWKFNRTGDDLGPDWFQTTYAVDGSNWREGSGLFGVETSPLPAPLGTSWPDDYTRSIVRYYYQIEFEFDGVAAGGDLALQHVVDDGAVFYLNGQELETADNRSTRFNMAAGEIGNTTLASPGVSNAKLSDVIPLDPDDFVVGTNTLSVEVHQSSSGSNDTVFGLQLLLRQAITPVVPGSDFQENDEEWIELFNRGTRTVDLTNWTFADGIDYSFEDGTTIGPGEFLVVARDVQTLGEKYPAVRILGPFSGTLRNSTDRIVLSDDVGNPADIVEYFDDGRWPTAADAGGSSLELQDPRADNSIGGSWSASDETERSQWNTYTYSGVTTSSAVGADNQWREFIFGMLDRGEILVDDVTVTDVATGEQIISNSSFEGDTVGGVAAGWRFLGNHRRSQVVVDPMDDTNQAMLIVANGATEHMHNHINTTLTSSISNNREYEISYRAKWVSGSPLLHSRLYFNRLARATTIDQPMATGTPGARNSTFAANVGPTYSDVRHSPAVPEPNQPITVIAVADDPDGVVTMNLWYSVDGGAWQSDSMSPVNGRYEGLIPGQAAASIVQFYVEGTDAAATVSTFPRADRASRALFKVNDGLASDTGVHNLRIIMTPDDADWLHTDINLMSNDRVGATVIYDEAEIFYDVGVRLSGSQRARPFQPRLSFNVRFNQDQLFRGVHQTMSLDRSDSTGFGQREVLLHHSMGQVGGLPAEYNDLVHIMTPRSEHTGGAEMQLARYTNVFLDSAYRNGSDGRLFEYELVYYPTTADAQGYKRPQPDSVIGTAIRNLGDEKERYRWTFLIKNNRGADDYERLIDWAKVMGTSGTSFHTAIDSVADVDQWLRAASFAAASGFGDQYGAGSQHNVQFFVNPQTRLMEMFPHDLDAFFNAGNSILPSNEISKIVNASPRNQHFYYGYMHHFVTTTYNVEYMQEFSNDFAELLPNQSWGSWLSDIGRRHNNVLGQINSRVAPIEFSVSTPGPIDAGSNSTVDVSGRGWVNVKELHVSGTGPIADVSWTTSSTWSATVPIDSSISQLTVEAYDFSGNLIGSETIDINTTADNPVLENLRITEINYNPAPPTSLELDRMPGLDNEDFEFIEFANVGMDPLSLLGTRVVDGISYSFGDSMLEPKQRGVVVRDRQAFELRYGSTRNILGQFDSGRLSNSGERIAYTDSQANLIASFEYATTDPWPTLADGAGATLTLLDADTLPVFYGKHYAWRPSVKQGGTPGAIADVPYSIVINEVRANPLEGQTDAIELLNAGDSTVDISGWFLSDAVSDLSKFQIPENSTLAPGQSLVFDEHQFNPPPSDNFGLSGTNGDDVYLTIPDDGGYQFVDEVHFSAAALGESWGRVPAGVGRLAPLSRSSLGCGSEHQWARIGPLILSEIQYNPGEPTADDLAIYAELTEDDLEYIEIYNPSYSPVNLTNWRLRGGISFDFSSNDVIPAGGTIVVVSFRPDRIDNLERQRAFRAHYGDPEMRLVGGWSGQLSDSGEEIRLLYAGPSPIEDPTLTPYLTADASLYDDRQPWPTDADGSGLALHRVLVASGHQADAWLADQATPGQAELATGISGDLSGDGTVNAVDIDLLLDGVRSETGNRVYDLDDSGVVDHGDVEYLVTNILGTVMGDANLDLVVDAIDLNAVGINWQRTGCFGWTGGDFDGDGEIMTNDLNVIGVNWLRSAGARLPRAPLSAVVTTDTSANPAEEVRPNGHATVQRQEFRSARRATTLDRRSHKFTLAELVDEAWRDFGGK